MRLQLSILAAAVLACGVPVRAEEAAAVWQAEVHTEQHMDAGPLTLLGHKDIWARIAPRPGRNLAYRVDEARLTRESGGWSWALLARQRATVVATRDALALGQRIEMGGAPAASRAWQVQARVLGFGGAGLEVSRPWDLGAGWRAWGGVQGLGLQRLLDRSLGGDAAYDTTLQRYTVDLFTQRADDRLKFPYQQAQASFGQALLLQGGLTWTRGPASAELHWRDAGWLLWSGLPQQVATLNNQLTTVDADGFLVYQPVVQGLNSQGRLRTWVAPTTEWQAHWQTQVLGRWTLGGQWLPGWGALPRLAWRQRWGTWGLDAGWRWHEQRAELAATHGHWRVGAGADALDGGRRSLALSLAWRSEGFSPGP